MNLPAATSGKPYSRSLESLGARISVHADVPGGPRAWLRRCGGFTLIEILITLVIISVGLLCIAALHSMSLRNNFDALIRSHASALADEIADRMRTNRTRALAGDYNVAVGATRTGLTQADADLIAWKA